MAHPQIAAFPRLAKENSPAARVISGQQTHLARTMHDLRYDAIHDEILVTNPFAMALLTFRGDANGEQPPIRIIQGPHTQLGSSAGLGGLDRADVDPVHDEIFVPNREAIFVFPRTGNGDVPPIRAIRGPDTELRAAASVAVDPVHNLLVVSDSGLLRIFNRTDDGNAKPRAEISAPPGMSFRRDSQMQVYPPKGWIFVSVIKHNPNLSEPWKLEFEGAGFGIWSINDNGQVPPRWKITGPQSLMKNTRAVAFNAKDKEVYVADMRQNAVLTYYFPEVF